MDVILDVPSPPRNLEVSDIFKTSCKIKWEVPEDDGGSPILHYIVERQDLSIKGLFLISNIKLHNINKIPIT